MMIGAGTPTPTNRSQQLYLEALREAKEHGKVTAFAWIDTRDNLANSLTKFSQSGLLEIAELTTMHEQAAWEPQQMFRWNTQQLVEPCKLKPQVFAAMPPSTKEMHEKIVEVPPLPSFPNNQKEQLETLD